VAQIELWGMEVGDDDLISPYKLQANQTLTLTLVRTSRGVSELFDLLCLIPGASSRRSCRALVPGERRVRIWQLDQSCRHVACVH
jgi:hypothetical protein